MPYAPYGAAGQMADYTPEINVIPNQWGRLQELGLFAFEGVATTTVIIDQVENGIEILPTVPRGGPSTRANQEIIKQIPFIIPYIPHSDFLTPSDVQDRRAPGSTELETVTRKRMVKMERLRRNQAQTLEFMRMGAVTGKVMNAQGQTLVNLFTEFNVTEKTIDFNLDDPQADVDAAIMELKRHMELNVFTGAPISGIMCMCSPEFMDKLTSHPKIVDAYKYYAAAQGQQDPARLDVRSRFVHKGVIFEEYNATVKTIDGTPKKFITAQHARAFPLGVADLFATYFAPADKMSYANTEGLEVYLFEYPSQRDDGFELESISAPLPICKRPQVLVDCYF